MPLLKGRGCKSAPDSVLAYITNPDKAAIVTSMSMDDERDYASQFRDTARMYDKAAGYGDRKYYHYVLSCARSDNATAEAHHRYAEDVAARLWPEHECVIATHTDTDTVHSHIIVNAVSFATGRCLDTRRAEYGRQKDLANAIGMQHGFSELAWRVPAADRLTPQERIVELRGGTSWKNELREVIKIAKQSAKTMGEFEQQLRAYGVVLSRNTDTTIAYRHPQKEKSIRGERLGADYTKGAIVNELEQNGRNDRQRAAAAVGRTETGGDREHAAESSVSGVERKVRSIAEGVHGLTTDGRAEAAARAAAEQRAAEAAAAAAERNSSKTPSRQPSFVDHDFGPGI